MAEEKSLPKPLTDLPAPEKELPSGNPEPTVGEPNPNEPPPEPVTNEAVENKAPVVAKADNPHKFSIILKSFLLGIIFIILLVIVGGGAYFLMKNSSNNSVPIPSPAPVVYEPTPDLTADWETYVNPKYSIKHPPGWKPTEEQLMTSIDPNLVTIYPPNYENDNYGQIYIRVKENPDSLNINQWISQDKGKWCFGTSINKPGIESSEVFLDELKGLELAIGENDFKCSPMKLILVSKENEVYELFTNAESEINKSIFNQVATTFKFRDPATQTPSPTPDPTSAWKSYTDVNFPFSIKYPADWKLRTTYGKSVNNVNNYRVAGIDITRNLTSGSTVIINVIDPQNLSFYDWMKSYSGYGLSLPPEPNFTYHDTPAYKFTDPGPDGREDYLAIFYELDDKIIYLGWNIFDYDQKTADEIMNSLKFN